MNTLNINVVTTVQPFHFFLIIALICVHEQFYRHRPSFESKTWKTDQGAINWKLAVIIMQSWAYHTGTLDADGNPINFGDDGGDTKDKYWQKYMTEESPYRAKYSPPIKVKSPQRPQSGNPFPKLLGKKKKPKWMSNEQYERLTVKSHAKRNVDASDPNEEYFENGGEVLRWPENTQRRAFSPSRKHKSGSPTSPDAGEQMEFEVQKDLAGPDRMQGTYRPRSAPLGKTPTKNLFKKENTGAFFNDLLEAPEATAVSKYTTPNGTGGMQYTTQADTTMPKRGRSPPRARSANRTQAAKHRKSSPVRHTREEFNDEPEEAGIIEYGDAYVIEDEEEAINRIQSAMINAVNKETSPNKAYQKARSQEDFRKIGDDYLVSGNCCKTTQPRV